VVRLLIEHVLRSARLNVALTDSWGRKIKALTAGCAPVEVIANPIDTSIYKPGQQRTCSPEGPRVLFLGAIIKAKGVYDLVESFRLLKSQGLKPHITMAGNREIDQVKARCKEAGVEDLFEFPGWVSETEKLSLLSRSDLLVLPSYAEGLPLCVLEAMACGLPVVCTDVGGLSDLVRHGENGFLFKPGEVRELALHIATLLNDDSLRQRIGQNNATKIKHDYSVEMIAKRIGNLYSEVLDDLLAHSR
jgi:glycosyltransferase involved in cell wall biosynthesis